MLDQAKCMVARNKLLLPCLDLFSFSKSDRLQNRINHPGKDIDHRLYVFGRAGEAHDVGRSVKAVFLGFCGYGELGDLLRRLIAL